MSRPSGLVDPEHDPAGAFRELRQYALGDLDTDHHDVYPHAGLVRDPALRQVLAYLSESYDRRDVAAIANQARREQLAEEREIDDPDQIELSDEQRVDPVDLPATFERTELARRAIRLEATETASRAIRDGRQSQVSYITGLPGYESDISGLHAINQLADWLVHSEQCKLVYLAALMGRGKTDLSLTLLEIVDDHYRRLRNASDLDSSVPTPEFAANFEVEPSRDDVDVGHIDNYDDLLEWAEGGSSEQVRWFIFDEASTELTAQSGKNAQKVAETMSPFVKKMRKLGINMIVIGHDKGDVHVAIRSLADFVDKTGTKTASFYAGIKKREPTGHLFDVSGIPPTSWTFDTDDSAEWDWGSAVEDGEAAIEGMSEDELREQRDERMARLYELTEISQSKIATAFGVSQKTVSRACQKYDFEATKSGVTA